MSDPASLPDAAARIRQLERRLERERLRRQEAERISESGIRRLYDLTTDLDRLVAAEPELGERGLALLAPGRAVANRTTPGGGGPGPVRAQQDRLAGRLAAERARWSDG